MSAANMHSRYSILTVKYGDEGSFNHHVQPSAVDIISSFIQVASRCSPGLLFISAVSRNSSGVRREQIERMPVKTAIWCPCWNNIQ